MFFLSAAVALAQSDDPKPGRRFAGIELLDQNSRPAPPPEKGLALLLSAPCAELTALLTAHRNAAAGSKIELVPIASGTGKCAAAALLDPRGRMPPALLLEDGVVRRIVRKPSPPADTMQQVRSWQGGRQIYDSLCTRCHGPDGADLGYFGIKSLAGIGSRAGEPKILELTEATGAVDLSAMSTADRAALAAYVAGL